MNEKQFEALKIALSAAKYSGTTDQQAYDLMHTVDSSYLTSKLITVNDVVVDVQASGNILDIIETESLTSNFWKWALHALKTTGLDMSDSKVQDRIDTLRTQGKLTIVQANNLKALVAMTEAQSLGLPKLRIDQIIEARKS